MPGKHYPGCFIDSHPRADQIAAWLRQGLTSNAVSAQLQRLDSDSRPLTSNAINLHRRLCLGIHAKRGRPSRVERPEDLPESASIDEVGEEALRIFLYRLRINPGSVTNKELVPILTAILRRQEKKSPKDPLDEAMASLLDESPEGQQPA